MFKKKLCYCRQTACASQNLVNCCATVEKTCTTNSSMELTESDNQPTCYKLQGGTKKAGPQTRDHNSVKS